MASPMTDTDIRGSLSASGAGAVAGSMLSRARSASKTQPLTAEAIAVADMPTPAPLSPIVLAGFVRMGEFALIILIGLALYLAYLPAIDGLFGRYLSASVIIALLSTLAFQTADIYQVQAFRGYEKQPGLLCF